MFDKLSLLAVIPEIILLVMACVILLFDVSVKSGRRGATYGLTMLTLAVVAALEAASATHGQTVYAFGNMVVNDAMGHWLKCFAAVSVMVSTLSRDRDPISGDRSGDHPMPGTPSRTHHGRHDQ